MKIFTIGHSTRSMEHFLSLLKAYRMEGLADVRAFPSSSRHPQFNKDNIEKKLSPEAIQYIWLGKELGGYRKKSEGLGDKSPNTGWKSEGFRTYADYTLSDGFTNGIKKLLEWAEGRTTAYMCAEKFYWRCHRRIISDYLTSRGHDIWHILDLDELRKHELTTFARVKKGVLTYPSQKDAAHTYLIWNEKNT